MADNIFISEQGSIYVATLPKASAFRNAFLKIGQASAPVAPTEIWRISNSTAPDAFYGGRLQVEKVSL